MVPPVSVLNREPMGMKPLTIMLKLRHIYTVSVLNREPMGMKLDGPNVNGPTRRLFQCSTASRWG